MLAAAGTAVAHFHEVAGAQAAVAARQSRDRTVQDLLNRSAQVSSTDPGLALRLAVSAQSLGPSPRGRGALNALLAAGYAGEVGSGRPLHTVEFRPDGAAVVLGGRDGELDIWAVDGDRFTRAGSLPVADEVTEDAAFTPRRKDSGDDRTAGKAVGRQRPGDPATAVRPGGRDPRRRPDGRVHP
nr:hypothetical protein GCM10020092_075280 [Actinoplanes digitatis]